MTGEREELVDNGMAERQQQIVQRYAVQLREVAVVEARRVSRSDGVRKCYEILNECALELAQLSRRRSTEAFGGRN